MVKRDIRNHKTALDDLVRHPELVGIDRHLIDWTIKELQLYVHHHTNCDKTCDIVYGFEEPFNHTIEVEVKNDNSWPSQKAPVQLENTARRFGDRIGYPCIKQIVYYYPSKNYEVVYENSRDRS